MSSFVNNHVLSMAEVEFDVNGHITHANKPLYSVKLLNLVHTHYHMVYSCRLHSKVVVPVYTRTYSMYIQLLYCTVHGMKEKRSHQQFLWYTMCGRAEEQNNSPVDTVFDRQQEALHVILVSSSRRLH